MFLPLKGRLDEAITEYRQTLELLPRSAQAHFRFGQALQTQHKFEAADLEYQKALELNPGTCQPISVWRGRWRPVRRHPFATVPRRWNWPTGGATFRRQVSVILDTLAAAYAEAGRFPEAVATAEKAEQLATTAGSKKLAGENRQRLELYRAGKPYHDPAPTAQ